jgi:tRNA G26 N,N-dimethylase Trm1
MVEESGVRWKMGGPFWGASIHDQEMVDELLARVDAAKDRQRPQATTNQAAVAATAEAVEAVEAVGAAETAETAEAVAAVAAVETAKAVETVETVGAGGDEIRIPTAERLTGILTSMSEELKDVAFYYSLPDLAACLQVCMPTHLEFKSALINAGYRVSHFHHDASAIKTDAPTNVVRAAYCVLRDAGPCLLLIALFLPLPLPLPLPCTSYPRCGT